MIESFTADMGSVIAPQDRPSDVRIRRVHNKAIDSDVALQRIDVIMLDDYVYCACAGPTLDAYTRLQNNESSVLYPLSDEELIDACEQGCVFHDLFWEFQDVASGDVSIYDFRPLSWGYQSLRGMIGGDDVANYKSIAAGAFIIPNITTRRTDSNNTPFKSGVVLGWNDYIADYLRAILTVN